MMEATPSRVTTFVFINIGFSCFKLNFFYCLFGEPSVVNCCLCVCISIFNVCLVSLNIFLTDSIIYHVFQRLTWKREGRFLPVTFILVSTLYEHFIASAAVTSTPSFLFFCFFYLTVIWNHAALQWWTTWNAVTTQLLKSSPCCHKLDWFLICECLIVTKYIIWSKSHIISLFYFIVLRIIQYCSGFHWHQVKTLVQLHYFAASFLNLWPTFCYIGWWAQCLQ